MRKIRRARGVRALSVPNMPAKDVWDAAYTRKYGADHLYLSSYWRQSFSCEQLRVRTDVALVSVREDNARELRDWGIRMLEHMGLPIE